MRYTKTWPSSVIVAQLLSKDVLTYVTARIVRRFSPNRKRNFKFSDCLSVAWEKRHSFFFRFLYCDLVDIRWPNTVFGRGLANVIQRAHNDCKKTNMPSIERSFYLINTRTSCAIFLHNWTHCIDGFNLLLQGYVKKGNDATNPAILSFFFVTKRTKLNARMRVKSKISIEWKNYAYFSRTTH